MNDLIVIALTAVFFTVAVAYVALCDRILGPDSEPVADHAAGDDRVDVAVESVTP